MPTRRMITAGLVAAVFPRQAPAAALHPDAALWDPHMHPMVEGYASGPNGQVYYRSYGDGPGIPVVVVHGGPAAGHRYMRAYAALAGSRRVIFYDQSGCGRSERPADLRRYTAETYVAELEALRRHLGLERMILLGHSWGGMLAPLYARAFPERVAAMVLAGTASRWRDFQDASQLWLREMGSKAVAVVRRAMRTGDTGSVAYRDLMDRYYSRHLCRLSPPPQWFLAEGEMIGCNPVYLALNGPSEFQMTGRFATLDLRPVLPTLTMPVLVTCGQYDEGPPWVARIIAGLLPNARLHVFDGLSHMSHIEDPVRVTRVTDIFLSHVT